MPLGSLCIQGPPLLLLEGGPLVRTVTGVHIGAAVGATSFLFYVPP